MNKIKITTASWTQAFIQHSHVYSLPLFLLHISCSFIKPTFVGDMFVLSVTRWILVAPQPRRSRPQTAGLLTDLHFIADTRTTEPVTGRTAPAVGPPAPRLFSLCPAEVCSPRCEDECGGGGGLFSVRPAAQLLLHRLCAALGRSVSGPGGQSKEGPRAGPDATG